MGGIFMSELVFHYNIGDQINHLTIMSKPYMVKRDGKENLKKIKCKCQCGTEKEIGYSSLRDGSVKSCGCLHSKQAKELGKSGKKYNADIIKHKLFNSWLNMKRRYPNGFVEEWRDYNYFYNWGINLWFERSCLIRIDQSKQYDPDNCRFVPKAYINKNNLNHEKAVATMISRYGGWYTATDEYKNRVKKTNLEKYGYEYVAQVPEFKDKIIQTNLERYGVEYTSQVPEIKTKIEATCFRKYGVKAPSQNQEIRDKQMNTCIERYGEPFPNQAKLTEQNNVKDFIESVSGKPFHSDRTILERKEIDLYNAELRLGIEYCGLYWHSEYRGKDNTYHYNKYKMCREKGVNLVTIFADEWLSKRFQVKEYLSSLVAQPIITDLTISDDAGPFFDQYSILPAQSYTFSVSLKDQDDTVGAASFILDDKCTMNQLLFKSGYRTIDNFNKILSRAISKCKELGCMNLYALSDNRLSFDDFYLESFTQYETIDPFGWYIGLSHSTSRYAQPLKCKHSRIWDCGAIIWKLNAER